MQRYTIEVSLDDLKDQGEVVPIYFVNELFAHAQAANVHLWSIERSPNHFLDVTFSTNNVGAMKYFTRRVYKMSTADEGTFDYPEAM